MPKRSTGESLFFQVAGQASGKNVVGSVQDLFYKADRRSPGFRSYRVAQGLARGTTLVFHSRLGSSDPIGTGGSLSAYQGSVFRGTGSSPFIALESADQRSVESTFGVEPTVLAPGYIKRACKEGQPLLYSEYHPGRPSEGRAARIRAISTFGSSSGKRSPPFHIPKPRTPKCRSMLF
jgi:hypothetical protein